jgi:patatin-related protein
MSGADSESGPGIQEVRLAVTMVGGVSLAIWMGGVAREISHVVQASRKSSGIDPAQERDQAEAIRACYGELLDLLRINVSVDVLTGTSAGGINAACLGVAEGFQSTLGDLRDVWLETGSFSKLLRDPDEDRPTSVLQGDEVMLRGLDEALNRIAEGSRGRINQDITVILTSTMVDGETTRFTDALGSRVRDTEHRLLFRFDGDFWKAGQSQTPLALAARSTASFPAAFELSRMPIADEAQQDKLHPDSSPYADAVSSHWLTDGGVLLNKPLAPALRAIFERAAGDDVRRLMLYVAPTGEIEVGQLKVDKTKPPLLGATLNRVVGAITSQTISAELEDLERHNEAVVRTRGTRVSLARMGTNLGRTPLVDDGLMADYRRRRVQTDAAALVREATRRLAQTEQDRPTIWATGTDTLLIDRAAEKLMSKIPKQLPFFEPDGEGAPTDALEHRFFDELCTFRTTAHEAAVGIGLQMVAAGFRLEPKGEQAKILNHARKSLHDCRGQASRASSVVQFVGEQFRTAPPSFDGDVTGEDLADWIGRLAEGWAVAGPGAATLTTQWKTLAKALQDAASTLRELDLPARARLPADLAEAWEDDRSSIRCLTAYLLPNVVSVGQICGRLLSLHVAERGLLAEPPSVDQRVDLVQVSADTRSLLNPLRDMAGKKLTGIQVHNFGAFYKRSWRANDWMWGRVDGAGWLVHTLLDPRRLRLLMDMDVDKDPGSRVDFATKVADTFKRLGWVCPGGPDDKEAALLLTDVAPLRDSLDKELAFLGLDGNLDPIDEAKAKGLGAEDSLPVSMPTTALVLARGIQSIIAADELPVVAQAAVDDVAAGADATLAKAFLAQFPGVTLQPSQPADLSGRVAPPPVATFDKNAPFDRGSASAQAMLRVQGLFRSCRIPDETFHTELGSQLLTNTLVKTAAVAVNAASAAGDMPGQVKPALGWLRYATRSAWWVTKGANDLPRPWNVAAGAVTAMAGVVLANTGNAFLQAVGLASLVGGLIFVLVSLLNLQRTWKSLAMVLGVVVVALFLFAAFIPWIRSWWFDWLGGLTHSWQTGQLAWEWFVVAAFILLPALDYMFRVVRLRLRRKPEEPRTGVKTT